MANTDLTVGEAASLADVPIRAVNKHIENNVLTLNARKGKARRHLPKEAVMFLSTVCNKSLKDLPRRHKRVIWEVVRKLPEPTEVEVAPGLQIDLRYFAEGRWEIAKRYVHARENYLIEDPEILGGTPVIKGTRITVHSVRGRLEGGDTIEDLMADYPDIPREAFEMANLYAQSNPLRGRPKGLPKH